MFIQCNVRNGQNIAAYFSLLPGSRPWGVCWLRLGLEPFTLPQLLPLLLLLLMQSRARVQMFSTTLAAQRAHFAPICLSGPICPFFALHLCSTKHCNTLQICTGLMHCTNATNWCNARMHFIALQSTPPVHCNNPLPWRTILMHRTDATNSCTYPLQCTVKHWTD